MSFSLIKQALTESKFSPTTRQKIDVLTQQLGREKAMRIVESFEITPDDYETWLNVILGYAEEEGINIKRKGDFMEVAGAVLENDPVPMDIEMQSAVLKTLWANYKAQQSHSKVQGAIRAKEEEEQLKYALKKFSKKGMEEEQYYNHEDPDHPSRIIPDEDLDYYSHSHSIMDRRGGDYRIKSKYNNKNDRYPTHDEMNRIKDVTGDEDEEAQFAQLYKASQGMEDEQYSDDAYDAMYDAVDELMDEAKEAARYGQFDEADRLRWRALTAVGNHNPKVRNWVQSFDFYDYVDEVGYAPDYEPEEDEEFTAADMEDDLGDRDSGWRDNFRDDEDWYAEQDADQDDLPFTDDEFDDTEEGQQIISRGREMQHSRELDDFDPASDEGMDKDQQIIDRGRNMKRSRDIEDFDVRSKPSVRFAAEQEEVGKDYSSPFTVGQTVISKKDKNPYLVKIPDGPGDQVGIQVGSRIQMVPRKDLTAYEQEENEEQQAPASSKKSILHDLLTGANSRDNLAKLQKQIEDEAANAWVHHHAKSPKNPHPKGSLAYKAWEKGFTSAAKDVWAPKPVLVDPKSKQKAKQKKK